ncbi:MAG: hypothetical protein FJX32_01810 [Alphaproteobacteria bacterium]|nr:hypothetical protein [Alphaproteobacteria bacterium]
MSHIRSRNAVSPLRRSASLPSFPSVDGLVRFLRPEEPVYCLRPGAPGFRFPHRLIRAEGSGLGAACQEFVLFGPTCDSANIMKGPWTLPGDIGQGDWIEIGQLWAYGTALRTAFNGFDRALVTEIADAPLRVTPHDILNAPRAA